MSEVETTEVAVDAPTEEDFVEAGEALTAAADASRPLQTYPLTLKTAPDATIEVGTVDSDDGSEAKATADIEGDTPEAEFVEV